MPKLMMNSERMPVLEILKKDPIALTASMQQERLSFHFDVLSDY